MPAERMAPAPEPFGMAGALGDAMRSVVFIFVPLVPMAELNRVAALNWRVLIDHCAEESSDSSSNERSHDETKHRGAKLWMVFEVATVLDEDERNHGDRDRSEPRDVLLPLHPK